MLQIVWPLFVTHPPFRRGRWNVCAGNSFRTRYEGNGLRDNTSCLRK